DTKEIGVEVALSDLVADLAAQADVELVFGHCLKRIALVVGLRILKVNGHIDGLSCNRDFMNSFPRPFEIWAAGRNNTYLRVVVAFTLFEMERFGGGIFERALANPF